MKSYLCKYVPPRANFLGTMSSEETALMKQHGKFLDDLLEQEMIVALGPVIDSTGGWGLSLYQVEDDFDMSAITSNDPLVVRGVGHYEIYPMLHIKMRSK